GEPETAKQRGDFPRVIERADRAVVVAEGDHHALDARVTHFGSDERTIAMNGRDAWSEAAGQMEPVNAFLEESIAGGEFGVISPIVGGLQLLRDRGEARE